jgi:serine protease
MQGTWSNDSVNNTGRCEFTHAIFGGGGGNPTVNNPGPQTGTVGVATSLTITASGGTPPYTWSATGLPAGLSINASSGVISGTPTTAATYNPSVTATDTSSHSGSTSFSWVVNPAGSCGSPGQKLGNPGFESGNVTWTATSGVIGQWSPSEPPHSGTWDAWMDGYGRSHTDTLTQNVTLPSGCSTYTLSLYLHIDTAETTTTIAYDTIKVQIIDGGVTSTLATYSNLNHASGYSLKSFNIASHAGHTITVKFLAVEDVSLQTSFVVDDTALNVS